MTDTTELIARLRKAQDWPGVAIRSSGVLKEAADALERQQSHLSQIRLITAKLFRIVRDAEAPALKESGDG